MDCPLPQEFYKEEGATWKSILLKILSGRKYPDPP